MRLYLKFVSSIIVMYLPLHSQVVQNTWVGGPGVCGTVSSFGSNFCNSSPSIFYLFPGYMRLVGNYSNLVEHLIDNTIGGWDNDPDIVDLNLDGANDLLVSDESGPDVVYWYRNLGCGNFSRNTIDGNIESVDEVVAVDYQGDGDMDVFAAAYPSRDVVLYRNDGSMSFTPVVIDTRVNLLYEAEGIDAGDLDNDGDVDIAVSAFSSLLGGLWWYENTGSSWTKRQIVNPIGCPAWDVIIWDFNNDGRRDIALSTKCRLYIFRNNGGTPPSFTSVILDNSLSDGYGLAVGDINNDGRMDIVLTDKGGSGYVYLYLNNGGFSFTKSIVDSSANIPMGVQIADFEPDGDLDIVVASRGNRIIYVYQNNSMTFTRMTPSIISRNYFGVGIGDLDGDADPDILVRAGTNSAKEGLWWYETILQYSLSGWLESSIYDAGVQRRWISATVAFSHCAMSGILVKLYVRASKDLVSWTPWIFVGDYTSTSTLPLPSPFDVINYRYLQYRIELYASSDQTKTPIVDYVRFDYDPLGSEDELGISENEKDKYSLKVSGRNLEIEAEGREISVFSVDGRIIIKKRDQLKVTLPRGIYKVSVDKNFHKVIIR